jgi:chlorobactene glucosyltransferase
VITLGTALLLGLAVVWAAQDLRRALTDPRLHLAPDSLTREVAALIPARNEAARITPLMQALAVETAALKQVVVVDDHSTDGTAEVVRAFAPALPQLTILSAATLPAGWAGKCWACAQAADHADARWLLFLDADVVPAPGLVSAMVSHAERHQLALLSVMPRLELGSGAERLVLPAFIAMIHALFPLAQVANPRSPLAFANGQALLIGQAAYRDLGGHGAVRGSILEDTELGQLAKRRGLAIAVLEATELCRVRMYTDWESLAEGLTKNAVAGLKSGGLRSTFVGLRQATVAFAPLAGLVVGTMIASTTILLMSLGALLLTLGSMVAVARRRFGLSLGWALIGPLGLAVYFGLTARAGLRLALGRGVSWKGRRVA